MKRRVLGWVFTSSPVTRCFRCLLWLAPIVLAVSFVPGGFIAAEARAAVPQSAHAAFPGGKGGIVFTSDRGNISEIYKVSADGSAQTRLTDPQTQSANEQPKWSPDGTRIVFTSHRDGEPEIYVMNADGSGQTRLTEFGTGHNNYEPFWSPDGKRIVFVSDRDGTEQLYVMNSDGTGQTRLTLGDPNTFNREPAWSPDGKKIAFARLSPGISAFQIWVINSDGSGASQLTTPPPVGNGTHTDPNWSPDGTKIAYTSMLPAYKVANWEIWAMNADGSDQHPLTLADDRDGHTACTSDGANWLPAYSPDGSQVVFETYRYPCPGGTPTGYTLWVMNADGGGQHSLIDSPGGSYINFQADWQPAVTRPSSGFAVSGSTPVQPNPSQDTHDQTPNTKCNSVKFAVDEALGTEVVGAFVTAHLPVSALLLARFLGGTGTEVDFPAGSNISNQAQKSREFKDLNTAVQAEVVRQLNAGNYQINLAAPPLTTIRFGGIFSDLYWGFRGTQGLAVSGSGSIQNRNYIGTLTYVIKDSYGFPPNDKLDHFGPQMRYLQTACGAPQHKGGARWFPDTITVTMPFNQPVGQ